MEKKLLINYIVINNNSLFTEKMKWKQECSMQINSKLRASSVLRNQERVHLCFTLWLKLSFILWECINKYWFNPANNNWSYACVYCAKK